MIKMWQVRCPTVVMVLGMVQLVQGLLLAGLSSFLVIHPWGLAHTTMPSFGLSLVLGGLFLLLADEMGEPLLARRIGALFPVMNWLTIAYFELRFGQGIVDASLYFILAIMTLVIMWNEQVCDEYKGE